MSDNKVVLIIVGVIGVLSMFYLNADAKEILLSIISFLAGSYIASNK